MANTKKHSYTLTPEDFAVVVKIQSKLNKIFGKMSVASIMRFALRHYLDHVSGGGK